MITHRQGKARQVRLGAKMVEFAVVIPVFFVFIFGLVEIGRGMMVSSIVTNAARVGCRTGTLPSKTNDDVNASITNVLSVGGVTGYSTTIQVNSVTANVSTAATADTITVKVAVPAANTSWLPSMLYVNRTISGQFSMPHE